jgi:hypothetical protein
VSDVARLVKHTALAREFGWSNRQILPVQSMLWEVVSQKIDYELIRSWERTRALSPDPGISSAFFAFVAASPPPFPVELLLPNGLRRATPSVLVSQPAVSPNDESFRRLALDLVPEEVVVTVQEADHERHVARF